MHDDVYIHRPKADRQGNVHLGLINDRLGLGLYWKFPRKEIPIVNQWQHFPQGDLRDGNRTGELQCAGSRLGTASTGHWSTCNRAKPGTFTSNWASSTGPGRSGRSNARSSAECVSATAGQP